MSEIGKRVRILRETHGLSQSEVARRAGVTPSAIHFIESGRTKEPSASTVAAIARAIGVEPGELFKAPAVPLGEASWTPHITAEDIERQARGGVGYGKLAIWRSQVEGFIRDRRGELETGSITRKEGWRLPTGQEAAPKWQEAETISLEDPVVREVWGVLVRREWARMSDEMRDYGIRGLIDNLLSKDPKLLRGEELENYREAVGLSAALLELGDLVIDIEREAIDAEVTQRREEAERELRKLMFGSAIQGDETA